MAREFNTTPHEQPPGAPVQDVFLNHVQSTRSPVTIFLVNGVKLQGIIPWFDEQVIILRRDGHTQLVYKHAVSTIMPVAPLALFDSGDENPSEQHEQPEN
ncbi:RNA chaperone Hfq [Kozakia baliensis]|uniref:RNA chaperone Hfq n=1 Tax=Kozakia baliensis TaxID=153496 RepID=UPI0038D0709C